MSVSKQYIHVSFNNGEEYFGILIDDHVQFLGEFGEMSLAYCKEQGIVTYMEKGAQVSFTVNY